MNFVGEVHHPCVHCGTLQDQRVADNGGEGDEGDSGIVSGSGSQGHQTVQGRAHRPLCLHPVV